MAISEARKAANKKWNEAHPYERITVLLKDGEREAVREAANKQGESVSGYIVEAVRRRMAQEGGSK